MGKLDTLKYHAVDTTAFLTCIHPVMAAFEVNVADMTNETSVHARFFSTALNYGGLGSLYSRGRDFSKNLFGITENSTERSRKIHDALYATFFNTIIQPPFYYVSGSRNVREILIGTSMTAIVSLFSGPAIGYSIDAYRDFTGMKNCERLPNSIRNLSPKTKKYVAALSTVASVASLAAIYGLNR